MIRTGILILGGNATISITLFVRNLIVARLIPIEDYGIAATFAMTMAVVEMASALGLQQQIVQAKEGEDPQFQNALQGFQVLRGLAAGLILLLLADPIARFLGTGEAAWAYRVLALIPVLNAFQHFDIHRMNRQSRFGPMILTGTVPAVVSLLAVWPLAHWFGDWRVMLFAIVIQSAVATLISHLVAQRRYGISFNPAVMRHSLRFGWPLLINGLVMYLVFQGDKLIVIRLFGLEALAVFAMGVTLTMTPAIILTKTTQSLFLPLLSQIDRTNEAGRKKFDRLATRVFSIYFLFGAAFPVCVLIVGEQFIHLVLGEKFATLVPLLTLLAVVQGVRVFKGAPSTIALAIGETANALWANLVRVAFLPLAAGFGLYTGDVSAVIFVALVAELLGFIVAIVFLRRISQMQTRSILGQAALSVCVMAIVLLVSYSAML